MALRDWSSPKIFTNTTKLTLARARNTTRLLHREKHWLHTEITGTLKSRVSTPPPSKKTSCYFKYRSVRGVVLWRCSIQINVWASPEILIPDYI